MCRSWSLSFSFWWHIASRSFLRKEATFLRPCMCANVYILSSCLIVALAAYRILGGILIFLQNIVSCRLAACFPLEKSKVILVSDLLRVIYFFFFLLEAPRIFSLSFRLKFSWWGALMWGFFHSLCGAHIVFCQIGDSCPSVLGIFMYYFFDDILFPFIFFWLSF